MKTNFKNTISAIIATLAIAPSFAFAAQLDAFRARPPIHINGNTTTEPAGLSPQQIKSIYNLPATGGHGTVAIIGANDDPQIEADLKVFSDKFKLPTCSTANGCFEKHKIDSSVKADKGWSLELSMDVEWVHAIAPNAKILLVEAKSPAGSNLLKAVDYARSRPDVVAISMSWGGPEFPQEINLENHFTSKYGAIFFASSGDNGAGVSWPAVSTNVVGVGGTSITFNSNGSLSKELAWTGSGGGISAYIKQPAFQSSYDVSRAKGQRAVPDVAYDADPASGFSVYDSLGFVTQKGGWFRLGGTSAGAPQWAAIQSLGLSSSNSKFYEDKASVDNGKFFRDITAGANGDCGFYCSARKKYDYVTGLGTPLTVSF